MLERLQAVRDQIQTNRELEKSLEEEIKFKKNQLKEIQESFYTLQERELHLSEILRTARDHIPRLKGTPNEDLTKADYAELEKWVSRAKSMESLKSIVLSLKELSKYKPRDIKANLYALIQKIIIEGPYNQKKN